MPTRIRRVPPSAAICHGLSPALLYSTALGEGAGRPCECMHRDDRSPESKASAQPVALRQALEWSVDAGVIDRARILRGWTRRDLAQHAHVDEGTLCDLFAGRRRPTFGTLRALCQALDLALEDVIEFSDAKSKVSGRPRE